MLWMFPSLPCFPNHEIVVLTFVHRYTTPYRSYALGKGKTINYSGNHKLSLHLSVRDSLKKLKTDYIDLLYVHWWVSNAREPQITHLEGKTLETQLIARNRN